MKRIATVGSVCAVILLWSVYNAADTSPQFPEPIAGYRNEPVGYDDLPPDNPATIDLGAMKMDADARALPSLPIRDLHDGMEITGTLLGIADSKAKVACIAVDITRQSEQEHQLIASHSDFFDLNNGTTAFRLSIRMPNCDGLLQITLLAMLMDDDGIPAGTESILATSTFSRSEP